MAAKDTGSYVVLNGQRLELKKHPTDFSVQADPDEVRQAPNVEDATRLSRHMARAMADSARVRDNAMAEVRKNSVAHHLYEVEGTGEEIVIADRVILELHREGTGEARADHGRVPPQARDAACGRARAARDQRNGAQSDSDGQRAGAPARGAVLHAGGGGGDPRTTPAVRPAVVPHDRPRSAIPM